MTGNLSQNSLKSEEVWEWLMAMKKAGGVALGKKGTHTCTKSMLLASLFKKKVFNFSNKILQSEFLKCVTVAVPVKTKASATRFCSMMQKRSERGSVAFSSLPLFVIQ